VAAEPDLRPGIAWVIWSYRERFETYVEDAIKEGEVPESIDPQAAALLIVGILYGVAFQFLVDPDKVKLQKMIDNVLLQVHRELSIH
jgi:hypothetical protein